MSYTTDDNSKPFKMNYAGQPDWADDMVEYLDVGCKVETAEVIRRDISSLFRKVRDNALAEAQSVLWNNKHRKAALLVKAIRPIKITMGTLGETPEQNKAEKP